MSQAVTAEILSEIYEDRGLVRFKKAEKGDRGWWVCLSDMAALIPDSAGEPFSLDQWLNLTPQTMAALDRFIERKSEEVWGAYAIAIELSRVPKSEEFAAFPLWIATRGRRIID